MRTMIVLAALALANGAAGTQEIAEHWPGEIAVHTAAAARCPPGVDVLGMVPAVGAAAEVPR